MSRGSAGTLFVVATPIGNLGDVTRRAAETLAAVPTVAAEDTRRTRALLTHLGISGKELVTLDANASERAVAALVERLSAGEDVALVTDAGTPSVSDPGTVLVRAAGAAGLRVVPIPGPSAVTTAVAVSGLVEGPFLFLGFLPRKGTKRRHLLERIRDSEEPVVLFEAPGRMRETLSDLAELMPERPACLARELTKLHEEITRGTLGELALGDLESRGEHTLVIARTEAPAEEATPAELDALIDARLAAGEPASSVATSLARSTGQPRRAIYQRVLARLARRPA